MEIDLKEKLDFAHIAANDPTERERALRTILLIESEIRNKKETKK